jgi:2-polyprenyl-3-methyl-5-hydroxy-6-metoxy-1,4-benzoquinol methylase
MDIKERYYKSYFQTRHFWEMSRVNFIEWLIRKHIGKCHSVIDAGCGDCAVSSVLAQKYDGCIFTGVDIALSCREQAEIQQDLPQNLKLVNSWDSVTAQVELILLLDVLEHIREPQTFLAFLKQKLVQNGYMIITVPAFQYLFSEHDRFLQHYRRYKYSNLKKELQNAGFQIVTGGYFFALLLLPRFVQKIFNLPAAKENALRPVTGWLNRLLAVILTIDARMTFFLCQKNIFIPGLSCAIIVRKSDAKL